MKRLIVKDHLSNNRIIYMPETFEVNFSDFGDMLFVNFGHLRSDVCIFFVPLYFDDKEICTNINRYGETKQKCIFRELKRYIIEDINMFMSDKPDEIYYGTFPLEDHNCFNTEEFEQRWYDYYEYIIDNLEMYTNKKQNNRSNKK